MSRYDAWKCTAPEEPEELIEAIDEIDAVVADLRAEPLTVELTYRYQFAAEKARQELTSDDQARLTNAFAGAWNRTGADTKLRIAAACYAGRTLPPDVEHPAPLPGSTKKVAS